MCERGWFYSFDLAKHRVQPSMGQFEHAIKLLKVGILNGTNQRMSETELYVWKYSLLRAQSNLFEFAANTTSNGINNKSIQDIFEKYVESFELFFINCPDECAFYKNHAMLDIFLKITVNEDVINTLPVFNTICQRAILAEKWSKRVTTMEEALSSSPGNFKIPLVIGKIYYRRNKYEEAEKYQEMSLERENNIDAMSAMISINANKARVLENEHHDHNGAEACLHIAYEWGNRLETNLMPGDSKLEMARVCYQLALDRTTQAWFVPHDRQRFIQEAFHYTNLALDTQFGCSKPRALKQLGECFWVTGEIQTALTNFRQSLTTESILKYMTLNLKTLLKYSSMYLMRQAGDTEQRQLVIDLSQDIQFAWDNITRKDDLKQICVDFARHLLLSRYNIINILEEIRNRNGINGRELLKWYCQIIEENRFLIRLHNDCRRIREDLE